jgi:hypothetical protein
MEEIEELAKEESASSGRRAEDQHAVKV